MNLASTYRTPEGATSISRIPPLVRLVLGIVAAALPAFGLVGAAATPASADPPTWAGVADSNGNSMVCNSDVAGMVQPGDARFVQWGADTGYSVTVSCVANLSGLDAQLRIGDLTIQVGYGTSGSYVNGYNSRVTPWNSDDHQLVRGIAYAIELDEPHRDLGKGVDPCAVIPGDGGSYVADQCLIRPIVTSYRQASGVAAFKARWDFLPQDGAHQACLASGGASYAMYCLPPGLGASPAYPGGPAVGTAATALMSRMPVVVSAKLYNTDGSAGHEVSNLSSFGSSKICEATTACEEPNDTGSAEPPPFPGGQPPNGPIPGGGGSGGQDCSITSWVLRDVTDQRSWTSDSPDKMSVILTDGHSYTITVYFEGSPASLRVQAKRGTKPLWQKTTTAPRSPEVFSGLTGDGERAQIAVTGFSDDGDIVPGCQSVITDEPENEGRPSLSECIGDEEFSLTSPGSWIRYALNGGYCVLSWAFVPSKPFEERLIELRTANPGAQSVTTALAPVASGVGRLVTVEPGNCEGPTVSAQGWTAQPFNLCTGWQHDAASAASIMARGIVALMALAKVWDIFMSAWQGERTQVFYVGHTADDVERLYG